MAVGLAVFVAVVVNTRLLTVSISKVSFDVADISNLTVPEAAVVVSSVVGTVSVAPEYKAPPVTSRKFEM